MQAQSWPMGILIPAYPTMTQTVGGPATGCEACELTVVGSTVGQVAVAYDAHVAEAHSIVTTARRELERLTGLGHRSAVASRAIAMLAVIAREVRPSVHDTWGRQETSSSWSADRVQEWAARTAAECDNVHDAQVQASLLHVEQAARMSRVAG
jgi:hypothetical protein